MCSPSISLPYAGLQLLKHQWKIRNDRPSTKLWSQGREQEAKSTWEQRKIAWKSSKYLHDPHAKDNEEQGCCQLNTDSTLRVLSWWLPLSLG